MPRVLRTLLLVATVVGLFSTLALAGEVPIGFMSYDVVAPGEAQFDVTNQTGINSSTFPDMTWPVTTPVSLTITSLVMNLTSGPPLTFGPGYFTLNPDGLSLDGTAIMLSSLTGAPVSATLTGTFGATNLTLNDGSHLTIDPNFSVSLTDFSGLLQDGDFVIIDGSYSSPVPEPATLAVLGSGLGSFVLLWRRKRKISARVASAKPARRALLGLLVVLCCAVMLVQSASAISTPVKLNAWSSPSTGIAGTNNVNITGSGFPGGAITPADVSSLSLSLTCGGAPTPATALLVTHILGSSYRIEFEIPGSISTSATYFVSASGTTSTGNPWASSNCSEVNVTASPLVTCLPTNSLTVLLQGARVTAYVPDGAWDSAQTGIQVVPIEPTGAATPIATPHVVNSCAANWATGETVCAANNTDVYLITGTTLNKTLTSGSNSTTGFSGGECMNCGVGMNGATNTAVITMGLSPSPSGSGLQFLDLATNTFGAPVPATHEISEDIVWDAGRNLILSPNEDGVYDLFDTSKTPPAEFALSVGGTLDSAGEDCGSGIALSTVEFTSDLLLANLNEATFSPGSWTAPHMFQTLPEFDPYIGPEAGTDGIAVAPGSHLGIVTGEFPDPPSAGNAIIAIQLPAPPVSGAPSLVDYAVANLPNDPDGNPFSMGCDPHTTTAYVSPSTGKAIGLVTDYGAIPCYENGIPKYVGVIDLQGVLSAPRKPGTHTAISPLPAGVVTFVKAQ